MAILFLVALVLAWPTFGLSILAWVALAFFKGKQKRGQIDQRHSRAALLEPLFNGRHAEFFNALDIPRVHGYEVSDDAAATCGRHIVTYIAHNPEEAAAFAQGLMKWQTKGDPRPADPVLAAESENQYGAKGDVHLVSYRAIEALMTNNKSLTCFRSLDYGRVVEERMKLEAANLFRKAANA